MSYVASLLLMLAPAQNVKNEQPTQPPPEIYAVTIRKEFDDNELAAEKKYKNQTILILGDVRAVKKDANGDFYVALQFFQNRQDAGLFCFIQKKREVEMVAGELREDDRIVVRGRVVGLENFASGHQGKGIRVDDVVVIRRPKR